MLNRGQHIIKKQAAELVKVKDENEALRGRIDWLQTGIEKLGMDPDGESFEEFVERAAAVIAAGTEEDQVRAAALRRFNATHPASAYFVFEQTNEYAAWQARRSKR